MPNHKYNNAIKEKQMKSYGHIDMNNNQVKRMVINEETSFPTPPTVGRLVFKDKRVWICVEIISDVPAWIPLTGVNSTYVHDQTTPSATWTVTHNLNTTSPIVQIYDNTGNMIIPNYVAPSTNNIIIVDFSTQITGRAIVMFGDTTVYPTV